MEDIPVIRRNCDYR